MIKHTVLFALLLLLLAFVAFEIFTESQAAQEDKPAAQVYKNIKVFTTVPASRIPGAMSYMSAALGVGCAHCHNESWESDDKYAKIAARRMVLMTQAINKEYFSGNNVVTCYTCHRGEPRTAPAISVEEALRESPLLQPAPVRAPANLPSVDELVGRYTKEVGGEAVAGIKTTLATGTETIALRDDATTSTPLSIMHESPDKLLVTRGEEKNRTSQGFDGARAWIRETQTTRSLLGDELADAKREARFWRHLKIRENYPRMVVLGIEKVNDRRAYVVGAADTEGNSEKLYFDVENGLLIRSTLVFKTVLGSIPEVTDYRDYKRVGGLKLPFTVIWSRPPLVRTRRFTEIRLNIAFDRSTFGRPNGN